MGDPSNPPPNSGQMPPGGWSVDEIVVPPLPKTPPIQATSIVPSDIQLQPGIEPVTFSGRSFDSITGLMFIEERGTDKLTITRHPVEAGAEITDHAYIEPAQLSLRMMATASTPQAKDDDQYLINIYNQVLDLQSGRSVFTIQTGKRLYENMLIESVGLTTDEKTENALMLQIDCREVIIISTQTVQLAPGGLHANPSKTMETQTNGAKQPLASTAAVPVNPATDTK